MKVWLREQGYLPIQHQKVGKRFVRGTTRQPCPCNSAGEKKKLDIFPHPLLFANPCRVCCRGVLLHPSIHIFRLCCRKNAKGPGKHVGERKSRREIKRENMFFVRSADGVSQNRSIRTIHPSYSSLSISPSFVAFINEIPSINQS